MAKDKIDLNSEEAQEIIKAQAEEKAKALAEDLYKERHTSETEGLVNKNSELLAEKKKVKTSLQETADELNSLKSKYDFEKIDEIAKELERQRQDAMTAEERFEERYNRREEEYSSERSTLMQEWDESRNKYESEIQLKTVALNKSLVTSGLVDAISEEGGYTHLLTPILADKVKVVQEDNDFVARVVENGEVKKGEDGKPLSIKELVHSFKEDEKYGLCFQGSGSNGGSASGSEGNRVEQTVELHRDAMSFAEKSKYVKEHGEEGYLKLPA